MYHTSTKIINQSDKIFFCRGTHCSWQTFSENQDQEVISFTFEVTEVTEGVVTGVGTADWGDPELVLMRCPLVDMQLCLLLCYLGASHRDPGGVIMPAGQGAEGAEAKPQDSSLGPLGCAHLHTCVYMHAHQGAEVP